MTWIEPELCERHYYTSCKVFLQDMFNLRQSSTEYEKYKREEREKLEHKLDLIARKVGSQMKQEIFPNKQDLTVEQEKELFKTLIKNELTGLSLD